MKWFKRKRQRVSKSPQAKAKEQEAKLNTHLMKVYLDDLKSHPEYAREIAREKFGLSPEPVGEEYTGDLASLAEQLEEHNRVENQLSRRGNKGSSGTLDKLINSEMGKTIGEGIIKMVIPQMQKMQEQQIAQPEQPQIAQPEPEQLAEPEPEPTKEEKMVSFITQLMVMSPTEAAMSIYQFKDNPKDIRSMIYSYVTETDFDSLVDSIPMIASHPGNEFLEPLAGRLDKKWMALVYDELNTLRKKDEENN